MRVISAEEYNRRKRGYITLENGEISPMEEWDYEPEIIPEYVDEEEIARLQAQIIGVSPSQFTEFAVHVPDKKAQKNVPFSFLNRRYLMLPYDTPSKRVLLKCGRQVEKSTMLGNRCLAYCCIINSFSVLYVSPTNQQTKKFSMDRLKEPVVISPILGAWVTSKLNDSVFEKQFINRSKITLRYAFLNADRVRGVAADCVLIDEIQDIITDNIPIIEECASHSDYKFFLYSGTPKSTDNTLEKYWTEQSTQNEWVVPCDRHGPTGGGASRYWNILSEDNIGPDGLICDKCKHPIDAMGPDSQWAAMNSEIRNKLTQPFDGYRIPQLMVPWLGWNEILDKQRRLTRARFYNEVLGLSYDSGTRPLTPQDIMDNCIQGFMMGEKSVSDFKAELGGANQVFCGIDWGTGEGSYTVLSLGAYIEDKFTIFYIHRFEGQETEPPVQLEIIEQIIKGFGVSIVGADYGGGYYPNDHLQRKFGRERIYKYQYSTPSQKVRWDPELRRFLVHRTEVMSDLFNAIKRRTIMRFPDWSQFRDPFGQDMLNIFSEYNEQMRQIQYKKSPDCTDDSFHSILLCFLASMLRIPRYDVLNPTAKTGSVATED